MSDTRGDTMAATRADADAEAETRPDASPRRMPRVLLVGYSFLGAAVCDLLLEGSLRLDGPSPWGSSVVVGMLFVWCVLLLLLGLTGRLRVAFAVTLGASAFLAAVNAAKLSFLGEPLVPSDVDHLRTPGFLVSMLPLRSVLLGVAGLVTTVALVLWVGSRLGGRYAPVRRGHAGWRRTLAARVVVVLGCAAALAHASTFNLPGNGWRAVYEGTGVEWAHWNQLRNYQYNGFVGGALYNLPTEAMGVPEGYGPETMAEIARRYAAAAEETNAGRDPARLADTNVVVVLSESLADPTRIEGLGLAEDPLVRTRELMAQHWGGDTLASFYGTGTSAMEFQVLTGQSLALFRPQLTTPYQQLVPGMADYPSAVGWLEGLGHRTVAIHPYSTEMYHRPEVYSILGFDEFVHDTTMRETGRIGRSPFISDDAAYAEVLHQLAASEEPVLAHVVTMQNHVPMAGSYPDPVEVEGAGGDAAEIGGWARGLDHSDRALPQFLESLADTGEPTVVVHFGDHYPGILGADLRAANPDQLLRTPLLVWATDDGTARDLGTTAPTAFLPLALERIGATVPPYLELLRQVDEEVGALRGEGVVLPDGREVGYDDLDAHQARLVEDLRLVQYDFSIGERFALDEMWYPLGEG